MSAPVSLHTPTIEKTPEAQDITKKYLDACYEKLPFALRHDAAQKQLADRAENFSDEVLKEAAGEPVEIRRRIR
jgi:hypothetical protein